MSIVSHKAFMRAVDNISHYGDTDVFPFPFDDHVFRDTPEAVVGALEDVCAKGGAFTQNMSDGYQNLPLRHVSALTPVSQYGFRWATQIDPFWNAYLLGLVLEIAEEIEAKRIPTSDKRVFSYRYDPNAVPRVFLEGGWGDFQTRAHDLATEKAYVVVTDIADFYPRVYHHRLENALAQAAPDADGVRREIMELLRVLSDNTSYGLPVGGPAARLLAELTLDQVDQLLVSNKDTRSFCRYVDDYRFFTDSLESAHNAIRFLSEKLHVNLGLTLQKTKTRILTGAEYRALAEPKEPEPRSLGAFMRLHIHYDPYSATADADYDALAESLRSFDVVSLIAAELSKSQVHPPFAKRLLRSLQHLDDNVRGPAAMTVLDNLEKLAPVLPQTLLVLARLCDHLRESEVESIQGRVRDLITSDHYLARIDLNLAYMVRILGKRFSEVNQNLLFDLFERCPAYIKRDIVLVMATWKNWPWVTDQRHYVTRDSMWVYRAFLATSYMLGDEGKHWRGSQKKLFSPYDVVIRDWAASKWENTRKWSVPL